MKRKLVILLTTIVMVMAVLTGCGNRIQEKETETTTEEMEANTEEAANQEAADQEVADTEAVVTEATTAVETETATKETEETASEVTAGKKLTIKTDPDAFVQQVGDFTTEDIEGNTVTQDIFAAKDLTVVNVWGTFCGPCIDEMPDLGEWATELPDNVQIIGMVCDITDIEDTEYIEYARALVEATDANYSHLIMNEDLQEVYDQVVAVPTTFFVDQTGKVIGDPIVGVDLEGYKAFVEEYLREY